MWSQSNYFEAVVVVVVDIVVEVLILVSVDIWFRYAQFKFN